VTVSAEGVNVNRGRLGKGRGVKSRQQPSRCELKCKGISESETREADAVIKKTRQTRRRIEKKTERMNSYATPTSAM
jgi:hypothetical protein